MDGCMHACMHVCMYTHHAQVDLDTAKSNMAGKSPNSLEVSLGKSSTNGKGIFHPKWRIPKPWLSILNGSKFGWFIGFVATPMSGNLHIQQPFSFPRRHVLAASCTRSLGGELWIDWNGASRFSGDSDGNETPIYEICDQREMVFSWSFN